MGEGEVWDWSWGCEAGLSGRLIAWLMVVVQRR